MMRCCSHQKPVKHGLRTLMIEYFGLISEGQGRGGRRERTAEVAHA